MNSSFGEAEKSRLEINNAVFQGLIAKSRSYLKRGQYQNSALFAKIAAYHATWNHNGLFASYELEQVLHSVAKHTIKTGDSSTIRNNTDVNSILHIASMVSGLAGLQHLLQRWIEYDGRRKHSVVVSEPSWIPVPERLKTLVKTSGGSIELVGNIYEGLLSRAQRMRNLATQADLIILHLQTEDVAPIIGLSQKTGLPPIILVNHADHAFWIGMTVIDLIANLRNSGLELCRERRGIDTKRLFILPTPIDPVRRTLSRREAKIRLGLPANAVVILSVARAIKYNSKNGDAFPVVHVPLLKKYKECYLLVLGPEHNGVWEHASQETDGRIRACGLRADTALYYQAADIYVDSFPMVSVTSLLEAGSFGLPLVSRCPHSTKAAVWCADAPGLDQYLINCRNVEEYRKELCCLVEDEKYRKELGQNTQSQITKTHAGEYWIEGLESLYAYVMKVSAEPAVSFQESQRDISELDLLTPELLSDGKGVETTFYKYRKVLPLDWQCLSLVVKYLWNRPIVLSTILFAQITARLPFKRQLKRLFLRVIVNQNNT